MESTWQQFIFWGVTILIIALAMAVKLAWTSVSLVLRAAGESALILVGCLFEFAYQLAATAFTAARKLPLAWYMFAILAAIPMCVHIPRPAILPFMTAYCACAYCVCETKKQTEMSRPLQEATFFTELKIQAPQVRHSRNCI